MAEPNSKNGNGRLQLVLLTIAAPSLIGAVIGWATTTNSRLVNHTERIAVIDALLQDTRSQLHAIHQKIDKLLERKP